MYMTKTQIVEWLRILQTGDMCKMSELVKVKYVEIAKN